QAARRHRQDHLLPQHRIPPQEAGDPGPVVVHQLTSAFGLLALLAICWAASNNRRAIPWRLVAWGTGLQLVFAVVILKTTPGHAVFAWLTAAFERFVAF